MVRPVDGYMVPEFERTTFDDVRIADLKAKTEEDFLRWIENAGFKKRDSGPMEKGSLVVIDGKVYIIMKEPKIGIRRACQVKSDGFLKRVSNHISIVGASHS